MQMGWRALSTSNVERAAWEMFQFSITENEHIRGKSGKIFNECQPASNISLFNNSIHPEGRKARGIYSLLSHPGSTFYQESCSFKCSSRLAQPS